MEELHTLVIYDIEEDKVRTKVADICKDYGLKRFQFSAFEGPLSRNRREELFLKLGDRLGETPGKIVLIAVCERDLRGRMERIVEKPAGQEPGPGQGAGAQNDRAKGDGHQAV